MNHEDLRQHLETHLGHHLTLLADWVGVNSFTRNPAGVNELGNRIAAAFTQLGFVAEEQSSARPDVGRHVRLRRAGRTERTVALVGHLDTVYTAEEEAANHFSFRQVGDRLYGPGVGDMKGGILLALMVLDAVAHAAPQVFADVTWEVGLSATEEILEPEFATWFRGCLTGRGLAVLVFEPGTLPAESWPLVVARKGQAQFRVEVEGRGAHAGLDFWQGRNALLDAARLALALAGISDRGLERTVNVGRLQGGTVVNRVPHAAVLEGEIRAHSPSVLDEGVEQIRRAVADLVAQGGQATLDLHDFVPPWPQNEGSERLLRVWQAAGGALGMPVTPQSRGGLSDGNYFSAHYPTLDGLGPAGAHFHCSEQSADGTKEQEFALRSSFVPRALLHCAALLSLLGTASG